MTGNDADGSPLRVRLLQTEPVLGKVEANLARLDELVAASSGADLVVTPELATHGYHLGLLDDSEPLSLSDPRVTALGRHGPTVVVGMVEQAGHRVHNTAAVVGADSVGAQRKLYLPTYRQWEEHKHFSPGGAITHHEVAGTRLAVLICNDLWQPVLPWLAAHGGAEVLVVPVNSVVSEVGRPTSEVWESILVHAALALQTYVVFVNRVGLEGGGRFWGGSRVIGPTGETVLRLGDDVEEGEVELDIPGLRRLRREWPLLRETRPELIAAEAQRLVDEQRI
jgi:predicted amidohydrolase